jgi:hypothetical protein
MCPKLRKAMPLHRNKPAVNQNQQTMGFANID